MCFLSYTAASFILSAICYLLFQSPYQTIERYIYGINKENIWQENSSSASTETLQTQTREEKRVEEDKVLYSRYVQQGAF